ncbi:hypothetical protein Tco_1162938 [Tanacetum coccineum]
MAGHQGKTHKTPRGQGQSPLTPTSYYNFHTCLQPYYHPSRSLSASTTGHDRRGCSMTVLVARAARTENGRLICLGPSEDWCSRRNERTIREMQMPPVEETRIMEMVRCKPGLCSGSAGQNQDQHVGDVEIKRGTGLNNHLRAPRPRKYVAIKDVTSFWHILRQERLDDLKSKLQTQNWKRYRSVKKFSQKYSRGLARRLPPTRQVNFLSCSTWCCTVDTGTP